MKILVLMAYYNRPKMARFALETLRHQNYKNWTLAFVDDGSDQPGSELVADILSDDLYKVAFYNTRDTEQQKLDQGGSRFGAYWNEAMYSSNSDIAVMLCDDDGLYGDYLEALAQFYDENKQIAYSYGHVRVYDPTLLPSVDNVVTHGDTFLNRNYLPINPYCQVDASQVSWRVRPAVEAGVKFPWPQTAALDADLYQQLFDQFGPCVYNGLVAQYKGVYAKQLGNRQDHFKGVE